MIGKSHIKIAHEMLPLLNPSVCSILREYINSFESGLDIPDRYMIWERDPKEPAEKGVQPKQLVHRYYLDANNDRKRGRLIDQIWTYTEGIISFLGEGADLSEAYSSVENLAENWVLYFGMLTHFLGDLCSPLHVGNCLDGEFRKISGNRYHSKIEQAMWRYHKDVKVTIGCTDTNTTLNTSQLVEVAEKTYVEYLLLKTLYPLLPETRNAFAKLSIRVFEHAVFLSAGWINTMIVQHGIESVLKEAIVKLEVPLKRDETRC